MSPSPTNEGAVNPNEMFAEHLAEIALDWVREPARTTPGGASSWSPATGFMTLLAKSKAELIDLTGPSHVIASPAFDLIAEPTILQHAA